MATVETGPQPDRDGRVVNDDPNRPLNPGHPLRAQDVDPLIPKHIDR